MRYSELTPSDIIVLRIEASLESAYPELAEKMGNRRPSLILTGWKAWKARQTISQERAA